MGFEQRLTLAAKHEADIIAKLKGLRWHAEPFGQAQLSDASRDLLKGYLDDRLHPTLLRWLPDIIAGYRRPDSSAYVCLIDAKVCNEKYANYSIERDAVHALACLTEHLAMPCFFVFDDWKILTARDALMRCEPGPRPYNGSGTPYWLVSRDFGRPFESVFMERPA
jgi:hypothetical protein